MKSINQAQSVQRATLRLWPEVAAILGLGRTAVYEAARRGEIPTIKIGKLRLVPRKAIERLLDVADSYSAQNRDTSDDRG